MIVRVIFFFTGLVLCVSGLIAYIRKEKRDRNAVILSTALEFLAFFVLVLPDAYAETSESVLRPLEVAVTALQKVVTRSWGAGIISYDRADVTVGQAAFLSLYNILVSVTNILIVFFVCGIIVSFIDGTRQQMKLVSFRRGNVYLFSECNEKTAAVAGSIRDDDAVLIFASVPDELPDRLKDSVDRLKPIMVGSDLFDVIDRLGAERSVLGKRHLDKIEIFIFNSSEEDNLRQLSEFAKLYKDDDPLSGTSSMVKVYAELYKTPWSLYDDAVRDITEGRNLIINLVRTEENFIYNLLADNSIFENAAEEDGVKKIKILIAGYTGRSIEFLKAVLWLGQMPGFELSVSLIEAGDHMDDLHHMIPELRPAGGGPGDAVYTFAHITGADYGTDRFESGLETCGEITYAFIDTGSDIQNIDIALRIDAANIRRRGTADDGCRLIVNINDAYISDIGLFNKERMKNIIFAGDAQSVYDHDFITMSKIERITQQVHDIRQEERKAAAGSTPYVKVTWKEYCNSEYNRHSVYARTLSFAFKAGFIDREKESFSDDKWKIWEHMRWNMYTRTLGYVLAPDNMERYKEGDKEGELKDRSLQKRARVHPDLIMFDELSPKEKAKDAMSDEAIDICSKLWEQKGGDA